MFHKSENEIAKKIKDSIEKMQLESEKPQVTAVFSPTDEIRKLKGLLDEGIISQDEFDEKKSDLLKKL